MIQWKIDLHDCKGYRTLWKEIPQDIAISDNAMQKELPKGHLTKKNAILNNTNIIIFKKGRKGESAK